jgi:hypothetical protein
VLEAPDFFGAENKLRSATGIILSDEFEKPSMVDDVMMKKRGESHRDKKERLYSPSSRDRSKW